MATLDSLKGKNKTFENATVKFHAAGIESQQVYSFIPYTSITRIWLGQLPPSITLMTLLGAIIAFVGLSLFFMQGTLGVLLGLIAVVGGIVIVVRSLKSWYALNIDMASGAIYSFSANKKEYVDKGYWLLLHEINEREENRGGDTYNFGDGTTINGPVGKGAKQINL